MSKITLDAALSETLHRLTEPAELCDPTGQVVGRFVPKDDRSEWEPVTPEVTDEELRQLAASDEPRYTTAEVIDYLEKL